jgi:hypothetical protein
MHPTISYHLAQARIADLRHHAQRDTLARAVRTPSRRHRPGRRPWVPGPGRARHQLGRSGRGRRRTH